MSTTYYNNHYFNYSLFDEIIIHNIQQDKIQIKLNWCLNLLDGCYYSYQPMSKIKTHHFRDK